MNVKRLLLHSMVSAIMLVTSIPAVAADQPAANKNPFLAGAEGGQFMLRSADGNYTLKPQFRLQLQHRAEIIQDSPNTNGFFLRRGRFGIAGNAMTTDLEYEVEFDFGTPDPGDFDAEGYYAQAGYMLIIFYLACACDRMDLHIASSFLDKDG